MEETLNPVGEVGICPHNILVPRHHGMRLVGVDVLEVQGLALGRVRQGDVTDLGVAVQPVVVIEAPLSPHGSLMTGGLVAMN